MTTIVALICAVCWIGKLQSPAQALVPLCKDVSYAERFTLPSGGCRLTAAEEIEMKNIQRQMLGQPPLDNHLYYKDQQTAKTVFGRAYEKAQTRYPSLGRMRNGKAALIGVGATFGLTMWFLGTDGERMPEGSLRGDWARDPNAAYSEAYSSSNYGGVRRGETLVTSASWSTSGSQITVKIGVTARALGTVSQFGNQTGRVGVWGGTAGSYPLSQTRGVQQGGQGSYQNYDTKSPVEITIPRNPEYTYVIGAQDYCGTDLCGPIREYTQIKPAESTGTVEGPRYTMNNVTTAADPAAEDSVEIGSGPSYNIFEQMRQDPEYVQNPNPAPNPDDVVERRQNPDGSETVRYADGTEQTTYPDGWIYRDPDGTAQPNNGIWTMPDGQPKPDGTNSPHANPDGNGNENPPVGGGDPNLSCPAEREPNLIIPPVNFEEKFPFSLVLAAFEVLGQLVGQPQAPVFELPMIGTQDLSRFDGPMATIRIVFFVLIGGILMPLMFFRMIRGGGEG